MDEKTYNRIKSIIVIGLILFLAASGYALLIGYFTIETWLLYMIYGIVGACVGLFFSWVIYKLFLEKYHYNYKARWTKDFLSSNEMPSEIAVVGDRRGGKDTLATAIVRFNADAFFTEIEKDLNKLKHDILYIFDFKKLDRWLQSNQVRKEFMNEPKSIKRQKFKRVFYDNRAFLKGKYMKKYCGESRRLARRFINNKPSGLVYDNKVKQSDFFDLLMDYIEGYIRIYVIEKMVISNQPFIELKEELDGLEIPAKKLSYEYFKIKLFNLFPWIKHLIIFDSEATLYWNSSDNAANIDNKGTNGTLEFFIGKGHFLKKFKYVTTIQVEDRAQPWYRELFELKIYLQGKFKLVSTSPIRRFFKRFSKGFYKFMNWILFKRTSGKKVTSKLEHVVNHGVSKTKRIIAKILQVLLVYPLKFTEYRIQKLTEREDSLLMESKLEFNVTMEFRNNGQSYTTRSIRTLSTRGFNGQNIKTKLVINILDTWPYYSTEHLGDAGDKLMELSKVKFSDIPEWSKDLHFDISEDGEHLQHKLYNQILDTYVPGRKQKKKAEENKKKK